MTKALRPLILTLEARYDANRQVKGNHLPNPLCA